MWKKCIFLQKLKMGIQYIVIIWFHIYNYQIIFVRDSFVTTDEKKTYTFDAMDSRIYYHVNSGSIYTCGEKYEYLLLSEQ